MDDFIAIIYHAEKKSLFSKYPKRIDSFTELGIRTPGK